MNIVKQLVGKFGAQSSFVKGIGTLISGIAISQLLLLLSSPLLTRLFSPSDFGILAVYIAALNIFLIVASGRYELAIPIPKNDRTAEALVLLSLFILFISTTVVTITSIVVLVYFPDLTRSGQTLQYLWLLPIGGFLAGIFQIFNYWGVRRKDFTKIAYAKLLQACSLIIFQITFYKFGAISLIGGHAAGQGFGSFRLARSFLAKKNLKHIKLKAIKVAAIHYRNFPLYSLAAGLCNSLGSQLPAFLFAYFFSSTVVGFYALAYRILALPMTVLGVAIGNVFLAHAPEAVRNGSIGSLIKTIYENLAHIAAPAIFLIMINGPSLFVIGFGSDWQQAGVYAQLMAPWLYLVFITSPLTTLMEVTQKQNIGLLFQAALLALRILAVLLFYSYGEIYTVAAFSIVSAMSWLWYLAWINRSAGNKHLALIVPIISSLLWGGVCCAPSILLNMASNDHHLIGIFLSAIFVILKFLITVKKILQSSKLYASSKIELTQV